MKYIKKPEIIEAILWDGTNLDEILQWCNGSATYEPMISGRNLLVIETTSQDKEGIRRAITIGDYVIKGVNGEYYSCKPDIFESTYELIATPSKNIIKILVDESCDMACVMLNDEHIMTGNFWDFHPGCHGIDKYGDFNTYSELASAIQNTINGETEIIVDKSWCY